jgi:sucrose-phosphate synthase
MNKYYIQLYSLEGFLCNDNPDFWRGKDCGSQINYILEFLENIAQHPRVRKVDLFTRRILDKGVALSCENEIKTINEKARIIHISCGGNSCRESIWDSLHEFVDKTIRFIKQRDDFADVVHGHDLEGNYVAGQISQVFGLPFIANGFSFGQNKKNVLTNQGLLVQVKNEKYNRNRRIRIEEEWLPDADAIIVSTQHEIEKQYGSYENKQRGKLKIISPAVNSKLFYPFYRIDMPSFVMSSEQEQALYLLNSNIERFLLHPGKPLILSVGRPDLRKNFETLIKSYGEDKTLQSMANLAIFAGVRKDISLMGSDEKDTLTNLLLLLDKYDLYGKVAIPKEIDPVIDVSEIFRLAARKKGVIIDVNTGENFDLSIIEAAACGLPAIAAQTGIAAEIMSRCNNGLQVDVEEPIALAEALKRMIADHVLWERCSSNGIVASNQFYSWHQHIDKYLELIEGLCQQKDTNIRITKPKTAFGIKLVKAKQFIICDLDGTLVTETKPEGLRELKRWIATRKDDVIFGVASGRSKELSADAFTKYDLPQADILICSAGSEIYYADNLILEKGWESHIDHHWKRKELQDALAAFPGICLQEPDAQCRFKLSYYVDTRLNADSIANLYKFLDEHKLRAKILLTENKFLDFLPYRAGKGSAIRYLSHKWKLPLQQIITAGNSSENPLAGKTKGIIIANYSRQMKELTDNKFLYYTKYELSWGVLDGIGIYNA